GCGWLPSPQLSDMARSEDWHRDWLAASESELGVVEWKEPCIELSPLGPKLGDERIVVVGVRGEEFLRPCAARPDEASLPSRGQPRLAAFGDGDAPDPVWPWAGRVDLCCEPAIGPTVRECSYVRGILDAVEPVRSPGGSGLDNAGRAG